MNCAMSPSKKGQGGVRISDSGFFCGCAWRLCGCVVYLWVVYDVRGMCGCLWVGVWHMVCVYLMCVYVCLGYGMCFLCGACGVWCDVHRCIVCVWGMCM